MAKTCSQRYKKITRITGMVAAVCGANVFRDDYKMSFLTWLVIGAINAYFACTIYTIYVGFFLNGDWKIILESLSLAGSAVQGYSKLLFGIFRRKSLVFLERKIEAIYKEFETDPDYTPRLRYRIDLTTKLLKTLMVVYFITSLTIMVYPIIYGQLYGVKLFIMKFYLPGIDSTTDMGYLIHNGFHAILIFLGSFGNFAGDMYVFIIITHIPLLKDALLIKCKKLNRTLSTAKNSKETLPMLKDIIYWHQSYNFYANEVDAAYYGVIFVQVFTSVFSISCTLFSIIIRSWPAAFVYLIYSMGFLYAYCGLGHLVEVSNDEVTDLIYGDCMWYELSVPEQKQVLLMLRKSQKPITLTIGQIMPLSMNTALQLTKAIYSYMMMLVNFLETDDL